jgi:hypothetical protein
MSLVSRLFFAPKSSFSWHLAIDRGGDHRKVETQSYCKLRTDERERKRERERGPKGVRERVQREKRKP